MKLIETLARILRVFGWFSIILGVIFLIQALFTHTVSPILGLSSTQRVLGGLVFLGLAHGFSKKEKWAWYTGFVVFILGFLFVVTEAFLIEFSVGSFFSILIYILLFGLLTKERQPFIEQPKEKISQWFRKPYFMIVVMGILISSLISGGILAYSISQRMEVQFPPEAIKTKPTELTIYKNEKYDFIIEYFTDKLAIEKDYETERLPNNPRLLYDAFFYDSNYGVNVTRTKSIPVLTIEVFECEEGDFNKCYSQIVCGPRRYVMGSMASSYGSSYFRIDGLLTNSLSFAWNSQEKMQGYATLKGQLLYVILGRTGAKYFKPVSEDIFNQVLSTFKFIKVEGGEIRAPDLTIEDVIWGTANPKVGDIISIKIKVKNIGNEISSSTEITAIDQKGWGWSGEIKELNPEEEATITLEITAKSIHIEYNPHIFNIKVDSHNLVDELNENNNEKIETIYVSAVETEIETADWKTYGYKNMSFQYPSQGWVVIFNSTVANQPNGFDISIVKESQLKSIQPNELNISTYDDRSGTPSPYIFSPERRFTFSQTGDSYIQFTIGDTPIYAGCAYYIEDEDTFNICNQIINTIKIK